MSYLKAKKIRKYVKNDFSLMYCYLYDDSLKSKIVIKGENFLTEKVLKRNVVQILKDNLFRKFHFNSSFLYYLKRFFS